MKGILKETDKVTALSGALATALFTILVWLWKREQAFTFAIWLLVFVIFTSAIVVTMSMQMSKIKVNMDKAYVTTYDTIDSSTPSAPSSGDSSE